jgi:hypothetical protein
VCSSYALNISALAALSSDWRSHCAAGFSCDGARRCAPDRDRDRDDIAVAGASCAYPRRCAAGLRCEKGVCSPAAVAGAACKTNNDCAGACRDHRCVALCGSR